MKLRALFLLLGAFFLAPIAADAQTTAPKPSCTITASSGSVFMGQTVNLSWTSKNATGGTITTLGAVEPSGIQGVIPVAPATTYVATFTGQGGSATCTVTVQVSTGNSGVVSPGSVENPGSTGAFPAGADSGSGSSFTATQSAGQSSFAGRGLLPCTGLNCQACHLAGLAQNIINFLIGLSIPLAAALFAYAGIKMFTSGGNPKSFTIARKVFTNVLIGFIIVVAAWLGIQTLLKAILAEGFYQSWNKIECVDESLRPKSKTLQDVLNILPFLRTEVQPVSVPAQYQVSSGGITYDDRSGCPSGTSWNAGIGLCVDSEGELVAPVGFTGGLGEYVEPNAYSTCYPGDFLQDGYCQGPEGGYWPYTQNASRYGPEGTCGPGYRYAEDADYAWCQGPGGVDDIADFLSPGRGGGPVVTCNPGEPGCGDIMASAASYHRADTSAGPDNGNLACVWAVNNVLKGAGIAPIDGNSVASMERELLGGRGTLLSTGQAQAGDIIVWKGHNGYKEVSHVGICQDAGCSRAISNSSSRASFDNIHTSTVLNGVAGRVYRVNR